MSWPYIPIGWPTAVPTEPANVFANVDQTSLIITIILSFGGLAWAIFSYAFFTKWCCCKGVSAFGKCKEKCKDICCQNEVTISESRKEDEEHDQNNCKTICGECQQSHVVINAFTTFHVASKPILIILNCVYFGVVGFHATNADILGLNKTTNLKETGASFANVLTFVIFVQELFTIIVFPIFSVFQWSFCFKRSLSENNNRGCSKFMEYWRYGDLTYAFIFAPFSNVNLFYLGGWWYIAIVARLAFYSLTFATAVIAGLRFIYPILCAILCECASNENAVELRSFKQLFLDIGLKMVAVALKIMTCSSALATYLQIGILVQSLGFRAAYFAFTMLRGITALFSLIFTAALLRWEALKEDERETGKFLKTLYMYEPHVHVSFFFDMLSYCGLLVLNFIIVHGILNQGFTI